jgi:hypothetical protein
VGNPSCLCVIVLPVSPVDRVTVRLCSPPPPPPQRAPVCMLGVPASSVCHCYSVTPPHHPPTPQQRTWQQLLGHKGTGGGNKVDRVRDALKCPPAGSPGQCRGTGQGRTDCLRALRMAQEVYRSNALHRRAGQEGGMQLGTVRRCLSGAALYDAPPCATL